jgi:hypothetical protein
MYMSLRHAPEVFNAAAHSTDVIKVDVIACLYVLYSQSDPLAAVVFEGATDCIPSTPIGCQQRARLHAY